MEAPKAAAPSTAPSTGNTANLINMPRYTYYLSNYQYLDPSANCAFSIDDERSQGIPPAFCADAGAEEHGPHFVQTRNVVAEVDAQVTEKANVVHSLGDETTDTNDQTGRAVVSPRFGAANTLDLISDRQVRPKVCVMEVDDELCSASVAGEYAHFDPEVSINVEENREPSTQLYIDQSLAAKMERWSAKYASGNTEEFRNRQKQHMHTLLGNVASKDRLQEFTIRCVVTKGETGAGGKFDPVYVKPGDLLVSRYLVVELLGSTSFSMVVKAHDDVTGEYVCVKISMPETIDQAIDEINLLTILNAKNPQEARAIVQLKDYFYFRGCIFTVLELLGPNLYEATRDLYKKRKVQLTPLVAREDQNNLDLDDKQGWALGTIRQIAIDVLTSLKYMHDMGIINCDLKPENIVLNSGDASPFVKLIDFGSSCYIQEQLSNYIQSRSYRAPEVILGLPYDTQIDLWSLGCLLVEIYMQRILFPSDNNATLMASMISLLGVPPVYILQHKMNSTFMVLPNGNVADLNMTTDILKNSQRNLPSDYQSSMRCNISVSNSSCSSLVATQLGNKADANTSVDFDSVADLNESHYSNTAVPTQEYTNITPRKYSITGNLSLGHCDVATRYNQVNKDLKLDIGHGRSNTKCVRIIEPTRCSIDQMLNTAKSPELRAFADFIKGLLQYDPLERLTAATALTHSFITKH
ncbi:protein kinase domain containing protein [Babesia divergens]|uniref:Protein kinase domain containing protein n=1 Tax=Babesia divergens TaxID=32595 RepID=A0AAD9G772_BABDI|nr:protein kinase domain containing protein [Babesia divergens]